MTSYYKPWYYTLSHILIGFFGASYPVILILALVYQLGQLIFDVRIFPVERKIEKGNSIEHTAIKLSEMGFGYIIGYILKNTKKSEEAIQL